MNIVIIYLFIYEFALADQDRAKSVRCCALLLLDIAFGTQPIRRKSKRTLYMLVIRMDSCVKFCIEILLLVCCD